VSARFEVRPSNLLSLEWEVRENGAPLGRIENTPLHVLEKGKLTAEGREYVVLREAVLRASYLLRAADGATRARARRKGAAGSAYLVQFDDAQILLKKKMLAGRETYLLTDAKGQAGSIVRERLLSRQMTVELEERASGLPREIVLFLVWIVLLIHGRDSAGSAG
jgi:hypothetical protein